MTAPPSKTPISDYLDLFSAPVTRKAYHMAMARFFLFLKGTLERERDPASHGAEALAEMDAAGVAYLEELRTGSRSATDDLVKFIAKLQKDYAPGTVGVNRSAIVGFLEENGVELSRLDERRIKKRLPRMRTVAEEEIITREHLQTLLPLYSIRDKAVVLVLVASGARIGEVLKLRLKDVDLKAVPPQVTFRGETTKNKERRISFLTSEAVTAVEAWLKIRDDYLGWAVQKNIGLIARGFSKPKRRDDDRLFPFHRGAFDSGWEQALDRAGLLRRCEVTGRLTMVPHGLRKCFRSWLGGVAGQDLPEVLMGHEGYLTGAYRRLTEDQLREGYLKHSHVLCVAEGSGELARQVAEQQEAIAGLQDQNATLQQRLMKLEGDLIEVGVLRAWLDRIGAAPPERP